MPDSNNWAQSSRGGRAVQSIIAVTVHLKESCEQLEKVYLDLGDRYFHVGKNLPIMEKVKLLLFFVRNVDVFAWNPYEAPRVDPEFICHQLNVEPNHPPIK